MLLVEKNEFVLAAGFGPLLRELCGELAASE